MSCRKFNGNLGGLTTARGGRGKTARRDAVIQADHEQASKGDRKEIPAYRTYTTIPLGIAGLMLQRHFRVGFPVRVDLTLRCV